MARAENHFGIRNLLDQNDTVKTHDVLSQKVVFTALRRVFRFDIGAIGLYNFLYV